MPASLSLAMIVKDEEETLGRVLADALPFCDELIVVDTGSVDGSREIARAGGAKVVEFEWIDDFAAARNFAFDQCSCEWIIWLDADDAVPPSAQEAFQSVKAELLGLGLDAVYTPYRYRVSPVTHRPIFSLYRERLVRRGAGLRWEGVVHEVISVPPGRSVRRDDCLVEHRPHPAKDVRRGDRNLRILERAVQAGRRDLRTLFYFGNELADNGRHEEALGAHRDFLDSGAAGWERYWALLRQSASAEALGRDHQSVSHLLAALREDPGRAEAYVRLAEHYYALEQWDKAIPLLLAATGAQRPDDGFITEADYRWLPWDYLAVCLSKTGRHNEAIPAALRSLELGNPEPERVQHNLRWSIDHLHGDEYG